MTVIPSTRRHRVTLFFSWLPIWLIGGLCLISFSGCRGCLRNDSEQLSREELEKKAREQKEALETKPLRTLPADTDIAITTAKAGHWVETIRQVKSNREDLQVVASGDVLRGPDKVLNIPFTSITTEFARPTVLPKGQTKTIDLQYFIPTTSIAVDPNNPTSTVLRLRSNLLSKSLLTPILQEQFSAAELGFSEFLLTVVSPKPQEYAFLASTDLVLWRGSDLMMEERLRCFRVVLCASKDGKIELPTSMLTMTMMAILVWDDLAPDDLSEDQKTAILDWLHWGGQLVISGPSSWSRLQNSFLSPYLPVRSAEATELGTEDLSAINHWVVQDVSGQAPETLKIVGSKMPGLKMTLSEKGTWLPHAEELVAERAIGRGRIVVTNFPLREQRLYRWKYFSSFLSTGILRRPARQVTTSRTDGSVMQQWAPPFRGDEKSPLFNTNLRIASRDIRLNANSSESAEEFAKLSEKELQNRVNATQDPIFANNPAQQPVEIVRYDERSPEPFQWAQNGAAWSDTSGFAFSAISTLRQAAGIVLPSRLTILTLIGCYLLVLVPLNWLFFRIIGRLELAWVAAPIMALIGVLVVTRVARLDIGFARRTTEIGLLELQGEYSRAHLTNYTALYTSLSTNYAMEFPERGSVVLPLGNVAQGPRRSGTGNKIVQAKYGTSAGMRLEPVTVYSNSTEMIHAEQMVSLPGGLLYGIPDASTAEGANTAAVKNATGMEMKSCCLLRKTESGQLQFAWLGDMLDDNSRTAKFVNADMQAPWENWNRDAVTRDPKARDSAEQTVQADEASKVKANELLMGDMLSELLTSVPLAPGQVRLFGYTDSRPSKMQSEPGDGALDTRTIIMAHLRPANWGDITRDKQVLGRMPNAAEPPDAKDKTTDEPAS